MIRLLIAIFFLLICRLVYADVYVIYNDSTKEVASVQADDSAVLKDGFKKQILKGSISDYPLEYNPLYYKFESNKFVVNVKKISDEENAKIIAKEKSDEKTLIDNKIRDLAIDELKKEGKTLKHFKKSNE